MAKEKFCDVGQHPTDKLWTARTRTTPSCCPKWECRQKQQKKPDKAKEKVKKDLNVFFASQALIFPESCEECDGRLNGSTMFDRRKSTCHILPKTSSGGFPSIATHPQNKMFLCCMGGCHGHERWDNGNADDRIKMNVYSKAVERFKTFEHLLSPREHERALKLLKLA